MGTMPPIHIPFLLEAANLSRMRSPMTSRSYCAKVMRMLTIILPALVAVFMSCVTAQNETPHSSNFFVRSAKSEMERDSLSIL